MKKPLIIIGIVLVVLAMCALPVFLLLGTLAVVGVQTTQKTYRNTLRVSELRNITESLEGYYTKYSSYPKLSDSALLTNIEKVTEKKDISLTYPNLNLLDPITGSNTAFSIKLSAPGVIMYTGTGNDKTINCVPYGNTEGNTLGSSTDVWQIFYSTNGNSPQKYTLLACTEQGLSGNFGASNGEKLKF